MLKSTFDKVFFYPNTPMRNWRDREKKLRDVQQRAKGTSNSKFQKKHSDSK